MSKRKKPLVYLTPENRAYYDAQLRYYNEFLKVMSERNPSNDQQRMKKFVDRINVSEFMCAIWYRFPAAVGKHSFATHTSSLVVALAKGVSCRLKDITQAVCDGLYNSGPILMMASAAASKSTARLFDTQAIRSAVDELTPAPPGIASMDVIFNREKYFEIDSLMIELVIPDTFEGDMFERLMEFDRAWERVTQALEFLIESLEFERNQTQPCN